MVTFRVTAIGTMRLERVLTKKSPDIPYHTLNGRADIFPLRHRGKWQSYFEISNVISAFAGPAIGGLLNSINWRFSYLVLVIMGFLSAVPVVWKLRLASIKVPFYVISTTRMMYHDAIIFAPSSTWRPTPKGSTVPRNSWSSLMS
jgi:hypothetical protein